MTVVMTRSQQHGRRAQRIDTRQAGRQSQKVRLCLAARSFSFLAREFDGFHVLSLLVESNVSLRSC